MWNLRSKQINIGGKKRQRGQTMKQTLNSREHPGGHQRGGVDGERADGDGGGHRAEHQGL